MTERDAACPDLERLLEELAGTFGCSGREARTARAIQNLLPEWLGPEDVWQDPLGSLIVRTGTANTGRRLLLDAHMDTIGLMVTELEQPDRARVRAVGYVPPEAFAGQSVVFENGARGRVETAPESGGQGLTVDDLRVCLDRAGPPVQIGDACGLKPGLRMENGLAAGAGLDNRAGCAALLRAVYGMRGARNDVFCVFSVQEEVGMRGAAMAAGQIDPDMAFVVDMGPAGDLPGCTRNTHVRLGGGVIEKMMDDSVICHPAATALLERAAGECSVPLMRLVGGAGYTNAGRMHLAGRGVPTAILGIPARNLHSAEEQASLADMEACARVLVRLAHGAGEKGE